MILCETTREMRLSSPGKSTRRREIARPQTRRRKGSFFFQQSRVRGREYRPVSLSRVFSDDFPLDARIAREREKSLLTLLRPSFSRSPPRNQWHSRRGKRTAAFNVNRYARLIYAGEKSARETKSRATEGESKREKERASDTAATQQIGETENEVERGGDNGGNTKRSEEGREEAENEEEEVRRRVEAYICIGKCVPTSRVSLARSASRSLSLSLFPSPTGPLSLAVVSPPRYPALSSTFRTGPSFLSFPLVDALSSSSLRFRVLFSTRALPLRVVVRSLVARAFFPRCFFFFSVRPRAVE